MERFIDEEKFGLEDCDKDKELRLMVIVWFCRYYIFGVWYIMSVRVGYLLRLF